MRKQDHLSHLIKSMNSNEKRYFKLFSELQSGNKRYAQLFEILESGEPYNVEKLCARINLTPKQLTDDKYYLQQMLLRCLRNCEDEASDTPAEHLVDIWKADVQVLLNRRLFGHALDLIEKTIQRALELEMFETALNLLSTERICLFNMELFDRLEINFNGYDRISKIQKELVDINRVRLTVWKLERKRTNTARFEKVLQEPLLRKKPTQLLSFKAQAAWFDIVSKCYIAGNLDKDESLAIARMQVKHYDKYEAMRKQHPLNWLLSYSYLANAEIEAGKVQNALQSLNELERLLDKQATVLSKATVAALKGHVYVFKTSLLFKLNRFSETISQAEQTVGYIAQRPLYEQIFILLYHSLAFMHLKRTDEALQKLNEILDLNTDDRMDLQVNIRPIIIMCHLDLGNYQTVPYLIKSAKAWMKRKKLISSELVLFFRFTYAISKATIAAERRKAWLDLSKATEKDILKEFDKQVNLTQWLQSKTVDGRMY